MTSIIQDLIFVPSLRRSGLKITKVVFGVCHDTGNDGSTARMNVNYYKNTPNEAEQSAHYFVDDQGAIQNVPESEKAWHVRHLVGIDKQMYGVSANDGAISVELCYGSKWTKERNMNSYQNYVWIWANICQRNNINPKTNLVAHATLDPSRRTDPLNAFKIIGVTWDQFIADVCAIYSPLPTLASQPPIDCSVEVATAKKSVIQSIITFLNGLIK